MKPNIHIAVFGTFGNPNGFTQTVKKKLLIKALDIKTSAIQLFPKTHMYGLRKELVGDKKVVSYTIYTYAQEQGSTRGGTFVGSSVIGVNVAFEEWECLKLLKEFHSKWISNTQNIYGGDIMVKHSNEIDFGDANIFSPLQNNMKSVEDIDFRLKGRALLLYDSQLEVQMSNYFNKGLEILSLYDSIYFTDSREIAEYTNKKGLIEVFDKERFNNSLSKVSEERGKEISKLKKEVKEWSEKVIKQNKDNETIIKEATEIHKRNQELIDKMQIEQNEIDNLIKPVFDSVKSLINNLSPSSANDIPKYSEINKIREQIKQEKQKLNHKLNPNNQNIERVYDNRSKIRVEEESNFYPQKRLPGWRTPEFPESDYPDEQEGFDKFKLVIAVIVFSLVLSLFGYGGYKVYKRFFPKNKVENVQKDKKKQELIGKTSLNFGANLTPEPNSILSQKDMDITIEKISKSENSMHVDEVVGIIFKINPNDIGKVYKEQKEEYGEYLKEKNPEVFKGNKLISTDFKEIPIYRK